MPNVPSLPAAGAREKARVSLRFEDVTQDGRLVLESLPNAIGPTVWRRMLTGDPFARFCKDRGIVPILSRFVLEGTAGPFSAGSDVEAETTYQIALSENDRVVLDVWADLRAAAGRTYGTAPESKEAILAGRVFAEHVFTRPFAPVGQRRVSADDFAGVVDFGPERLASPPGATLAVIPPGATPLEPAPRVDPVPLAFGLVHTDSNAHVNSLVYLRVCEEAALRAFVELGRGATVLGRRIDIAYRKPCFAGETVRVVRQAFELAGRLGVTAVIVPAAAAAGAAALLTARPYAFAQMFFES